MFVPTRAEVESWRPTSARNGLRLTTAFYHGGEPIRVIRPFSRRRSSVHFSSR